MYRTWYDYNNYNTSYNYYYNINLKPKVQKQLHQKYWRIHNAKINTENIHKYLQHKIKRKIIKY
jgi:hypothetical protein